MQVADRQPGAGLFARLLAGDDGQQAVQVEGARAAGILDCPGPALARAVGCQLDAVAVGIGKVDGLAPCILVRVAERRNAACASSSREGKSSA
jgi:hypothetical protein